MKQSPHKIPKPIRDIIPFYGDYKPNPFDDNCNAECLGNFYIKQFIVESSTNPFIDGIFLTAEGAFQAAKFGNPTIIEQFRNANGDEAIKLKKKYAHCIDPDFVSERKNWRVMLEILRCKFADGELRDFLLKTKDHFLLEHNVVIGRDKIWSDNLDGSGNNWLGLQLMIIRDEIRSEMKIPETKWKEFIDSLIDKNTGDAPGQTEPPQKWKDYVKHASKIINDFCDSQSSTVPSCIKPGCRRPTYNGQPGEFCSRTCRNQGSASSISIPTCIKPGCGRPTYNGQPGEFCSRSCRNQGSASSVPTCIKPGCRRPTYNGRPGKFCSITCRDT